MAYGQTDQIIALGKDLKESIDLLVAVATGKKGKDEVRAWLEKNYPDRRVETVKTNKW